MLEDLKDREPKLLERVTNACRARQFSDRTVEAYCGWIRRYVLYHGTRHPAELGSDDVANFLTHLAADRNVSPSTQNQAASSLLFLYREVLSIPIAPPEGVMRADGAGAIRAPEREHDDDLYACIESGWAWREEPAGSAVASNVASVSQGYLDRIRSRALQGFEAAGAVGVGVGGGVGMGVGMRQIKQPIDGGHAVLILV